MEPFRLVVALSARSERGPERNLGEGKDFLRGGGCLFFSLPVSLCRRDIHSFFALLGEVAKWSNAPRSGRGPSGSGVRTPPSSRFVMWKERRLSQAGCCVHYFFLIRYGVVGNMSGSHPVASGSIPGIGYIILKVWFS